MATPTNVPTVSNISINNNVNNAINILGVNILCHSNLKNIGLKLGGALKKLVGTLVISIGIPINVVITIPINRAPLIFLANKIPVIKIPIIASNASPLVILPKATIVPPSLG